MNSYSIKTNGDKETFLIIMQLTSAKHKITRTKTSIRYAKENDREKRERKKGRRRDIERDKRERERAKNVRLIGILAYPKMQIFNI